MNARARNFIAANEESPAVYCSVDGRCVTYRLANGKMFRLNVEEARQAPNPRWSFVEAKRDARALRMHEREERELLAKVEAEMRR